MMTCKFCNSEMSVESETNAQNHRQYKAFYTCPYCSAMYEGEFIQSKNGAKTISERWWNPTTKQFER